MVIDSVIFLALHNSGRHKQLLYNGVQTVILSSRTSDVDVQPGAPQDIDNFWL